MKIKLTDHYGKSTTGTLTEVKTWIKSLKERDLIFRIQSKKSCTFGRPNYSIKVPTGNKTFKMKNIYVEVIK
jgi:hypothetical protein